MKNRLIVLSTEPNTPDGNKGIFDALFNEEITIEPNSEIALQSVSINKALTFLIIDATDNKIQFQIQGANVQGYGGLHTIELNTGTYSKTNILDLFNEIETRMNKLLNVRASAEHGSQISVGIDQDEKLHFSFHQNKAINFVQNIAGNTAVKYRNISLGANFLFGQGGTGLLRTSFAACKPEFVKGAGVFRMRFRKFENDTASTHAGGIIGLIPNTPENQDKIVSNTITNADYQFAIRTASNNISSGNYEIKTSVAGGFVETSLSPFKTSEGTHTENDVLEIQLNEGSLRLVVHSNDSGGSSSLLHAEDYDFGTADSRDSFLMVMGIYGAQATTKIDFCSGNVDPYDSKNVLLGDTLETELYTVGVVPTPQQRTASSINNLIFNSLNMANFFGFSAVEQNPTDERVSNADFIGNKDFSLMLATNTYLVELLNLPVDSYHSKAKGRKNILSSIPITENIINSTGQIQYEPNTLFYVALNNKFPINLRNIKARVISNDFSEIETEGLAELSLLIRSHTD